MEKNVPSNSDGFAITTVFIFLGVVSPLKRVLCLLVPQNLLGQDYTTILLLPHHRFVLSHLLTASALFISHWGDSKVSWCWNIFPHVFAVPSTT